VSIAPVGNGRIVVLDAENRTILELDDPSTGGAAEDEPRLRPTQLRDPVAVRSDALERLYVSDASERRVVIFDSELRLLERMPELPFEALGLAAGQISGLALGPTGEMYIADASNGRVYELDAAGGFVRDFGSSEELWARLQRPSAVAIAPADRAVYVCDAALGRIGVFEHDGTPRGILGGGSLKEPVALAVGPRGQCIVADRASKSIIVLSRHGELIRTIDGADLGVPAFGGPADVVFTDSTLWIADPPTGRVLQVRVREPGSN
jgi:DNA-binding beta-propeller fold protein YncE